jgi:hypothetical protein
MQRFRPSGALTPVLTARRSLPSLRSRSGSVLWLLAALVLCGVVVEGAAAPLASAQGQVAALECRLGGGPWQPCRMEVEDIGLHWVLRVGEQRIDFRHSGDGAVRMQKGGGPWQPVTATWQPDTSLCWDGVCARGDIPLD